MTEAEHQRFPDDYEAQGGQGTTTFHNEEHLTTPDKGVIMLRKLLAQQIRAVSEGGDPAGFVPAEGDSTVTVRAGNFLPD